MCAWVVVVREEQNFSVALNDYFGDSERMPCCSGDKFNEATSPLL